MFLLRYFCASIQYSKTTYLKRSFHSQPGLGASKKQGFLRRSEVVSPIYTPPTTNMLHMKIPFWKRRNIQPNHEFLGSMLYFAGFSSSGELELYLLLCLQAKDLYFSNSTGCMSKESIPNEKLFIYQSMYMFFSRSRKNWPYQFYQHVNPRKLSFSKAGSTTKNSRVYSPSKYLYGEIPII